MITLTPEQLAEIIADATAKGVEIGMRMTTEAPKRSSAAERQKRYRDRNASVTKHHESVTEHNESVTTPILPPPPLPLSPQTPLSPTPPPTRTQCASEAGAEAFALTAPEPKAKRFTPPTRDQWQAFAATLSPKWSAGDSEGAFDHYVANGWKVGGKSPMKDWQAACRNCHRNQQPARAQAAQPPSAANLPPTHDRWNS